jgi:MuDR family transposase
LKVKYDGFFKPIKNGTQQKYYFGKLKTFHLDPISYTFNELLEELNRIRHLQENQVLSLCFLDKGKKIFIAPKDDSSFVMMLTMYEEEKEVQIYLTVLNKNTPCDSLKMNMDLREDVTLQTEENGEDNHFNYEEESDYCHSESSYHSIHSSDDKEYMSSDEDGGADLELEAEVYSYDKDKHVMEDSAQYPNVTTFRRSLNHYALTTDFEFSVEKSDPTRLTARCAKKDCS